MSQYKDKIQNYLTKQKNINFHHQSPISANLNPTLTGIDLNIHSSVVSSKWRTKPDLTPFKEIARIHDLTHLDIILNYVGHVLQS